MHLCGDQHLAVVVKQGINAFGDGPYQFTSPALVNTIYGRWWHPADEKPGPNPVPGSPLPWTGDFHDGLGNKLSMMAYANPPDIKNEKERGDGYGLVRFSKKARTVTFECWPRFSDLKPSPAAQFPGWPITVRMDDNDGRKPTGWLPELIIEGAPNAVVQVIAETTGEILYTTRTPGPRWRPHVFGPGKFTLKTGRDQPDGPAFPHLSGSPETADAGKLTIRL